MNAQSSAGGTPDLLSSIMGVTVRNEEKIAAEDRAFCEDRQTKLHTVLHQLRWWYGLFTANAERYRESHNLAYEENGSVDTRRLRRVYPSGEREDYAAFEFLPFDAIDDVVKLYGKAVEAFGGDIVGHFNRKYGVSVPGPDIDDEKLPMGFLPTYQTYVDAVIGHLGGKGFRETAEEELIVRFHDAVMPGYSKKLKAELKGDRIVVSDRLYYEDYSWNTTLRLKWDCMERLNALCAGILFGESGSLNVGTNFLAGFDRGDIDVSRWYDLNISKSVSVKFFKDGRVDFRFGNAAVAERCWKKLRCNLLWKMFRHGMIEHRGLYLNLETMAVNPIFV